MDFFVFSEVKQSRSVYCCPTQGMWSAGIAARAGSAVGLFRRLLSSQNAHLTFARNQRARFVGLVDGATRWCAKVRPRTPPPRTVTVIRAARPLRGAAL